MTGRSGVEHSLSRPPQWRSAYRLAIKPPVNVEVDLAERSAWALRFGIRPAHTLRSVVQSVLGLLFTLLAVVSAALAASDPTGDAVVGTAVLVGFAALFLSTGIAAIVSARRRLGVDLTPGVLLLGLGGGRTMIDWGDVADVAASTDSGHDVIVVTTRDDTVSTIPCRRLKVDPTVVFHALRYYFVHSSSRTELGGDRALHRVSSGQLT